MIHKELRVLIILDILFILLTLFFFVIFFENNEITATITETNDDSTVINIQSLSNWKILLKHTALMITFDLILLTLINLIKYKMKKQLNQLLLITIICVINVLLTMLLFPGIIFISIIIGIILFAVYFIKSEKGM